MGRLNILNKVMDNVNYWIWEHASKYGMVEVLRCLKSKFLQIDLPSSWLSALLLNQVKKDWDKPGKIDYRILINIQEVLTSTIKLYRKELKRKIKMTSYIKMLLYCRATILLMRWQEKKSNERVWKRAIDELFPIWTNQIWIKIINTYNLKELVKEDIGQIHSEIRQKLLCKEAQGKQILETFHDEMNHHFPFLMTFLFQLQPSTLEKIKTQNTVLGPNMDFVTSRLKGAINEDVLLQLIKECSIKKVKLKCQKLLKMMKYTSKTDETTSVFHAAMFTLPPDLAGQGVPDTSHASYPACTNHYPHIPSDITIFRSGKIQEFSVNKDFPVSADGTRFEPYWFCEVTGDSQYPIPISKIKQEKNQDDRLPLKQLEHRTVNTTYLVSRELTNSAIVDTPKKAGINRLSLSRSGSPRTIKPSGAKSLPKDGVSTVSPAKSDHISSSATVNESTKTGSNPSVASVICRYDSDTQTIKIIPSKVLNTEQREARSEHVIRKETSDSAASGAATVSLELVNSCATVVASSIVCGRSEPSSKAANILSQLKNIVAGNEEQQPSPVSKTSEPTNISTATARDIRVGERERFQQRRKTSRLERKSTEESSDDICVSSEDDISLARRILTRSLKTSVHSDTVLSGRKLRSGKALGKIRKDVDDEDEISQSDERGKVGLVPKKGLPARATGTSAKVISKPEESVSSRRTSTAADDSDSDFKPASKKRHGRKIESDTELSSVRTQTSSPRRNSTVPRSASKPTSPVDTQDAEQSMDSEQSDPSACNSLKQVKSNQSIPRPEGKNKATKRKLDLESAANAKLSESPRSKRLYMPTAPPKKHHDVTKAVELLQRNVIHLRSRSDTVAHAEALDRCVKRIQRTQNSSTQGNSDGDVADIASLVKRTRHRVKK